MDVAAVGETRRDAQVDHDVEIPRDLGCQLPEQVALADPGQAHERQRPAHRFDQERPELVARHRELIDTVDQERLELGPGLRAQPC